MLLSEAAGIVISLLVAFSLVALLAAGTMLASGAHADVQRRLAAIGVQRALGFTPAAIAARQRARGGARRAARRRGRDRGRRAGRCAGLPASLLAALNEQPPGGALAHRCWPAWPPSSRSSPPPRPGPRGGPPAARPRRSCAAATSRAPRRARGAGRGGLLALGAGFSLAPRGRWLASVLTIAVSAGVVLLMLALASLLVRLRDDPGTVGKRYQLTARLSASQLPAVRALPGVRDAAPRYQLAAADSFRLGAAGAADRLPRRPHPLRGAAARVRPAAAGGERGRGRARAGGGARAAGRVDARGAGAGRRRDPPARGGRGARAREPRARRLRPRHAAARRRAGAPADARDPPDRGRGPGRRRGRAGRTGRAHARVGGATTSNAQFLGILATVLRGVGLAIGLVCLYALVQALAITARERRGAVALLRAAGGDRATVALVLAGAALAVLVPAALAAVRARAGGARSAGRILAAGFAASSSSRRVSGRSPPSWPGCSRWGPRRPPSSRGAPCGIRSSPGCGRSDADRARRLPGRGRPRRRLRRGRPGRARRLARR